MFFIRAIFKLYISIFQLIALNIFYKQHIKTYVLSKTLKISPACFGHLATILREIQYLSLLQLLNYRCSSMPAAVCVLGPVLSCDCYAFSGIYFIYFICSNFCSPCSKTNKCRVIIKNCAIFLCDVGKHITHSEWIQQNWRASLQF